MKEEDVPDMEQDDKCKEEVSLEPRKVAVISQDKKFLDEFLDFLEKNISDEDINIDVLCKKLVISRSTLFRRIKQITDKTPFEFIRSYRLDRAAQLLRENYGNVTEVSEAVGFSDQYYFSKCFKEKFCQPPKQYQLAHLKTSEGELPGEQEEADSGSNKPLPPKPLNACTIGELDGELIARSAQMLIKGKSAFNKLDGTTQRDELFKQFIEYYNLNLKLNETLGYYSIDEIIHQLQKMIDARKGDVSRDGIYSDKRLDLFDITDNRVRMNAHAVAAVCMSSDLSPDSNGYFKLRVKTYGPTFNLHKDELFFNQPIGAGRMCTGILVGEDLIVTAAHFANERNVSDLRFVFDFLMLDPITPIEKIPAENIYKGIEIIERVHNPERDWTLVKLDRKVTGREIAVLSKTNIFYEQPVYVIGHPCGLPLKYAPGTRVEDFTGSYFRADLDIYASSSGSPVFCSKTHEVIGIVSRAKPVDFRWTGKCWVTMRYPKTDIDSQGARCTRTSEFGKYVVR